MAKLIEEATLDELTLAIRERTAACVVVFFSKYPDAPGDYGLRTYGDDPTVRGLIEYARDLMREAMVLGASPEEDDSGLGHQS